MTDHEESSVEAHATADHADSASTASPGRSLASALVLLGVFLVTSITGLGLEFLGHIEFDMASYLEWVIPTGMILLSFHWRFAAVITLVAPMAILRAVLLRKESGKRAVPIVEAAMIVALAIALSVPPYLLPWKPIGGWVLSLLPEPALPSVDSMPYSAESLLTVGPFLSETTRRRIWVLHGITVPLALIGVGAAFVHRRRRVMKERKAQRVDVPEDRQA